MLASIHCTGHLTVFAFFLPAAGTAATDSGSATAFVFRDAALAGLATAGGARADAAPAAAVATFRLLMVTMARARNSVVGLGKCTRFFGARW